MMNEAPLIVTIVTETLFSTEGHFSRGALDKWCFRFGRMRCRGSRVGVRVGIGEKGGWVFGEASSVIEFVFLELRKGGGLRQG